MTNRAILHELTVLGPGLYGSSGVARAGGGLGVQPPIKKCQKKSKDKIVENKKS